MGEEIDALDRDHSGNSGCRNKRRKHGDEEPPDCTQVSCAMRP